MVITLPLSMQVTPDYWHYVSWRASHRLFSSMLGIFATQSLLSAVGIGAQRSLPAAAAINWVLKDGLGRLGRLGVAAAFGQSFDADVKVGRLRSGCYVPAPSEQPTEAALACPNLCFSRSD